MENLQRNTAECALSSDTISFSKRKSRNCPESRGHLTQLASLSIQQDYTILNTLH